MAVCLHHYDRSSTMPQVGSSVFLRQRGRSPVRCWYGNGMAKMHEVTVLENGYHYRDVTHRSLTSLARQITGIHRSGPAFFGVTSHAQ